MCALDPLHVPFWAAQPLIERRNLPLPHGTPRAAHLHSSGIKPSPLPSISLGHNRNGRPNYVLPTHQPILRGSFLN
jgi:hypothetical protein